MINTRIIRWILADILTIMNQYVSRKFHNSKRYAFLFFFILKRIITFHRTIRIDFNPSRSIFSRDEDSNFAFDAIIGCNSMMNDYISRSTLTEKNPNRWLDRKPKRLSMGAATSFYRLFCNIVSGTSLLRPRAHKIAIQYESVSFKR